MPLTALFNKPKLTGVTCGFCDWHGTKEQVINAVVMNEDSTTYTVKTCPNCLRNGGLVFHDDEK